MPKPKIYIPYKKWVKLISELKKRGKNSSESGAFLLCPEDELTVTNIIFYDDLDPDAFNTGIIVLKGSSFIQLWDYCKNNNLKVKVDVHTHPSEYTNQSITDKNNPMIAQKGHISLIIPCYASKKKQLLNGVGIFEYKGNHKWKQWQEKYNIIKILN